jgi:CDP-glucose 4,6-dehydratase
MQIPPGQRLRELNGPLLLTGHTGFKGTWMTFLLEHLNVPVVGYSLNAEKDSLFDRGERNGAIPEEFSDIRDYEALEEFIDTHQPSTIIHMAAQPLVLKSYESPRDTFDVNVMGTVNILDIAFKKDFVKAIIVVTTDKVYRNDNSGRPFVETDPLEGKDPYGASKVATESVVTAWRQILKTYGGPNLLSVRAGNVIGGGDFAEDRLIPDIIRGLINNKPITIRNRKSIRPWQHVLDPLVGYLYALEEILINNRLESLNFGPRETKVSVENLVEKAITITPKLIPLVRFIEESNKELEAEKLQITSENSFKTLRWAPVWNSEIAITATFKWWNEYLEEQISVEELCHRDIINFFN